MASYIHDNVMRAVDHLQNGEAEVTSSQEMRDILDGWKSAYETQVREVEAERLKAKVSEAKAVAMAAVLRMLKILNVAGQGYAELNALTEHTSLNGVQLTLAQYVWSEAFDKYLLGQNVPAPSAYRVDVPKVF